jgi:hypothetical protein
MPQNDGTPVRLEQEAYSGFGDLMYALRRPVDPGPPPPCQSPPPVGITLTDGHGTTINPEPPPKFCGLPQDSVVEAIRVLPWKTVYQEPTLLTVPDSQPS